MTPESTLSFNEVIDVSSVLSNQTVGVETVTGYELIEEIGRGGMGVVFKARQRSLGRIVALKMVLGGNNELELQRFRTEAEVIGRLQHANIVQVYEVNDNNGKPFYTLEFCPNGNLTTKLAGNPLPGIDAAELVEQLARGMSAVHAAGIVHRDLKPQNILISADGTPKVTDFGVAKTVASANNFTQTGAILGTPGYMAPEQAGGNSRHVGPGADVYALGAILYECLTGRPPFMAASPVDVLMMVVEQEPVPPRILNRSIDPDLERIALKCLEKDPAKRYRTAADLAEDLRRFRHGEPITARSVNLMERIQRAIGRSQHDAKLRPWGNGLIVLGMLICGMHTATSLLLFNEISTWPAFWVPRLAFFVLLGFWLWRFHFGSGLLPSNPLERLLWAVWGGYFLAFASIFWVTSAQGHGHLEMYGAGMALSGLAWFAMGGTIWGGCYVIGILYMIAAPSMTLLDGTPWPPAAFGLAWALTLFVVGGRYRRLGRVIESPDSVPKCASTVDQPSDPG